MSEVRVRSLIPLHDVPGQEYRIYGLTANKVGCVGSHGTTTDLLTERQLSRIHSTVMAVNEHIRRSVALHTSDFVGGQPADPMFLTGQIETQVK